LICVSDVSAAGIGFDVDIGVQFDFVAHRAKIYFLFGMVLMLSLGLVLAAVFSDVA
jgi:hypothetical protein